ncbi:MAG: hypothetical protein EFKGCFLK_00664 [Rhodocyclaceae bacterium]|nr:hypothetical protein [Rhodocyclaceae bacterium]CAG0926614.1 hypothetical protein RHDC3_00106 [Rhodocyclaceae bacterium]
MLKLYIILQGIQSSHLPLPLPLSPPQAGRGEKNPLSRWRERVGERVDYLALLSTTRRALPTGRSMLATGITRTRAEIPM